MFLVYNISVCVPRDTEWRIIPGTMCSIIGYCYFVLIAYMWWTTPSISRNFRKSTGLFTCWKSVQCRATMNFEKYITYVCTYNKKGSCLQKAAVWIPLQPLPNLYI